MDDRVYDRSRVLVPFETRQLRVLVAGAGMVGSWTTAALARMCQSVTLYDHDAIEAVNVGVQMYTPTHVGQLKAATVEELCSGLPVTGHDDPIEAYKKDAGMDAYDVVVSAVDSMAVRKWLATEAMNAGVWLFVDVRVKGEMVCVLTAMEELDYLRYIETIPSDEEVEDVDCGSEGTVYSGMFAAARVAASVNNWARGIAPRTKEVWNVALMEHLDKHMEGGDSGYSQVNASGEVEPDEPDIEDTADSDWQADEAVREQAVIEADRRETEAFG